MTAQRDIAEAEFDDHGYQELRANAYSLIAHLLGAAPTEATLERLLGITSTDSEPPGRRQRQPGTGLACVA